MAQACQLMFVFALAGSAAAFTTPPLTDYVTYLGGAGAESVAGIAVDSGGSEYVAGTTTSPHFRLTTTGFGSPSAGLSSLSASQTPKHWPSEWTPPGTCILPRN